MPRVLPYTTQIKCVPSRTFRSAVKGSEKAWHRSRQKLARSTDSFHIATLQNAVQEIVRGNANHKVVIDSSGRFTGVSDNDSILNHQSILLLSRAHRSLTPYDFQRFLPRGKSTSMKVIPCDSLGGRRHSSWILHFSSVREAKVYQDTALEQWSSILKAVSKARSSLNNVSPYETLSSEKLPYVCIQDCTISTPCQPLSLVACMSPLPRKIKRRIDKYAYTFGHDSLIGESYVVEVRVRGRRIPALTATDIKNLLQIDATQRQHRWRLATIAYPIIPISRQFLQADSPQLPKGDTSVHSILPANAWRIAFECQSDARRFTRLWHKKSLTSFGSAYASESSAYFETRVAMELFPSS